MANESQRRVRLRLARQRTAPDRVRARIRDETLESQERRKPRQWQDITVLVSVIGLAVSAVGALVQVMVSSDQLQQSNETEERRARAQASRVWLWVGRQRDGKQRVHLTNRSPDPISQVFAEFSAVDGRTGRFPSPRWGIYFHTLPPCSDLVFSQRQLWYDDRSVERRVRWEGPYNDKPAGIPWQPMDGKSTLIAPVLMFVDRDGTEWARYSEGQLDRVPHNLSYVPHDWRGIVVGQPVVEKAEPCDDPA